MSEDIPFRLIIIGQFVAMGMVRAYFGAPRSEVAEATQARRAESPWLMVTLSVTALLHFGAILTYLASPPLGMEPARGRRTHSMDRHSDQLLGRCRRDLGSRCARSKLQSYAPGCR